ncbi:MAG: hypothetical protein K2I91_05910 [Muribaculaceae bacterium]|nr:hypothetical protein [Muribaculaceae bacterium]
MIVAICVVIGFKREITQRVTGFNADIVISALPSYAEDGSAEGDNILTLTPTLRKILEQFRFVTDVAVQVNMPAVLKTSDDFAGVYIKSLSGNQIYDFLESSLVAGHIPDNDSSIMVSAGIANSLLLEAGDTIPTYFLANTVRMNKMIVSGIFNSHFEDYDNNFVFTLSSPILRHSSLSDAQGTAIAVRVDNFAKVDEYTHIIQQTLMKAYNDELIYKPLHVTNARSTGGAYFHWLDMLDTNVWVILILMTVVAVVTLISGMLIMMVDKVRFIALMSALGASRKLLGRVFVLLAVRVALTGLLVGDIIGIGLVAIQKYTLFIPLAPDSYYIDFVPVAFNWYALSLLNIAVIIIAFLMLILPSRYVGKISPVRVLMRE